MGSLPLCGGTFARSYSVSISYHAPGQVFAGSHRIDPLRTLRGTIRGKCKCLVLSAQSLGDELLFACSCVAFDKKWPKSASCCGKSLRYRLPIQNRQRLLRAGSWQNGFSPRIFVLSRQFFFFIRMSSLGFSPKLCGTKCPDKILQNLYSKNPRLIRQAKIAVAMPWSPRSGETPP